jgi:hypothetical protein
MQIGMHFKSTSRKYSKKCNRVKMAGMMAVRVKNPKMWTR